jgi:multiple antibiotic resistance protein
MFAAMTPGCPEADRRRMAAIGTAVAGAILLLFALAGDFLLRALGISLAAFRIAGGVLLFLVAIDMVFARQSGLRSTTPSEDDEALHRADVSVFPLAIPLIAGPGAIASVLLLMTEAQGQALVQLVVLAVLAGVLGLTLAALLLAGRLAALLGTTGVNVVSRVLGIVLAALATQFIVDGVHAVLPPG